MRRRHVLVGSVAVLGAAGGLAVGWALLPQRSRLSGAAPLPTAPGQVALNGWVKLATDGTVTVMMAHVEMGQGTHTGLAMLLADEMDADWARVRVEQASLDPIYNNQAAIRDTLPFAPDEQGLLPRAGRQVLGKLLREIPGLSVTGGSASIADLWLPMREAGASARQLLLQAAAQVWGVPAQDCQARDGRVIHPAGHSLDYGELAVAAAALPLPEAPPLKPAGQRRLIGQPLHRIDTAGKIDGSCRYGADIQLPGQRYASLRLCPSVGGRLADYRPAADAPAGVMRYVVLEPVPGGRGTSGTTSGGLAAIADSPWAAMRALEMAHIDWTPGPAAGLSSDALLSELSAVARSGPGAVKREVGDVDAGFKGALSVVEADYQVPLLAHATMEPMNCTVMFKDGSAMVWAPTQMPGFTRSAVARVLGIDAAQVTVHTPPLGGGFGRRSISDFAVQAAALAMHTAGAPVQLLWSREQDMSHDYYRPAYAAHYRAGLDADGRILAWLARSAGSSLGASAAMDSSAEGATDKRYALPNLRVEHVGMESPLPLGIWRSVHHSQGAFFFESFMDEVAHAAGRDPLALRRSLLHDQPRALRVLERAAELAGWGSSLPAQPAQRSGRGLALHSCFGSHAAQVVEAAVSADGRIQVLRLICVADCGTVVNPQLVHQQLESAVIFGLSAALRGEITVIDGVVQQSNFHDYAPLRMSETPDILIELIASDAPPGGVGELGTPPVAPALANALCAATGQRLRRLPLRFPVAAP